MRGPRFANIKNKRGSRKGNLAKTVTLMGPICVSASSNHLIKYSLQSFCFFFWQNAGLKHGKVLVPYFVSYFHEIRFWVTHVWAIRGPSFGNSKDKRGLKDRELGHEGSLSELYEFLLQVTIQVNIHCNNFVCSCGKMLVCTWQGAGPIYSKLFTWQQISSRPCFNHKRAKLFSI